MKHRLPVGTIIPIDPQLITGTSTVLTQLASAGLPSSRVVHDYLARRRYGLSCPNMGCKVAPTRCPHVTDQVSEAVALQGATYLTQGQSWVYNGPMPDSVTLKKQTDRAHSAGLGAVAIRMVNPDGSDLNRPEYGPVYAQQGITLARFEKEWDTYQTHTVEHLHTLGFDRVITACASDHFELMPETWDATHLDTAGAVVVGDIHGLSETFFNEFLPAIGTDKELSNPDVLLISVGDIHDKGPVAGSVELLHWWVWAIRSGRALMTDSNHSRNLVEYLAGKRHTISPAMEQVVAELDRMDGGAELKNDILMTFSRLPSHLMFKDLAVVHAALTQDRVGSKSLKDRKFMLYTIQTVEPWDWTGSQTLVHGHDTVATVTERQHPGAGRVINVDTGAVTGGLLTGYHHDTGTYTHVVPYRHETVPGTDIHSPVELAYV